MYENWINLMILETGQRVLGRDSWCLWAVGVGDCLRYIYLVDYLNYLNQPKNVEDRNKIKICEMFATDDIPHPIIVCTYGGGGQPP